MKSSPLTCAAVAAIAASFLIGCGGKEPAATPAQTSTPQTQTTSATSESDATSAAPPSAPGQTRRQDEVWSDADGNKFLGSVPFDAFYDQPYTIASNVTPLNGATPALSTDTVPGGMGGAAMPPPVAPTTDATEPAGTESTASADGAWDAMMPAATLDAEVKQVRNFLNGTLQSVGSYNSSMLMIEPKAASVAVLAGIALEHPADISWKEDALYIRDLAKKMTASPLMRGKKDQARLLALFENMTDIFNKSKPADLEEPSAEDGFVDVAEMRFVMKRMEEAEQRMKTEAGSESAFASKKDMIKHEAAILKTFTHVIALEEYGYGDDEEFTGYAKDVMTAAENIQNSVEAGDFSTYQVALSKISTNCQQCHSVYKNN